MVLETNLIPGAGDLQAKDPPVLIPEETNKMIMMISTCEEHHHLIKMADKIYFPGHKESCVVKEGAEADGDE